MITVPQWGSELQPFEIRKHLKVGFQMVRFSNSPALAMAIAIASTIQKPDQSKSRCFCWISNGFWQNGSNLSRFQMVGLPDYRSHSKSRPFTTQPVLDHSKSRLGRISESPLYLCFLSNRCFSRILICTSCSTKSATVISATSSPLVSRLLKLQNGSV